MQRILFAHPNQKLTDIHSQHMRPYFNIDSVSDGLSAVRTLKLTKPMVVVSDYNLPMLSGLAFLRFVRSSPEFSMMPFMFLTDHDDNSQALSLGATDWLNIKETHPEILLDRIYLSLKIRHGI